VVQRYGRLLGIDLRDVQQAALGVAPASDDPQPSPRAVPKPQQHGSAT